MVASAGTRGNDPEKQRREADYGASFIELSPQQLLGRITLSEAQLVDAASDELKGTDILKVEVSDLARTLRMNKELYDDAEDFISESSALGELINLNRSVGTHETGEAVRFLRSARAAIFFYEQGIEPEVYINPDTIESDEPASKQESEPSDSTAA